MQVLFRSSAMRWMTLPVAVLILASLACGTVTQPTTAPAVGLPTTAPATPLPPTVAPNQPSSGTTGGGPGTVSLDIQNQSGSSVCYVYITRSDQADWGPDQLGSSNTIGPQSSFSINNIPAGTYDILTEDCDYNLLSWNYGVELNADNTLTVSGSADTVVIDNTSSKDICQINISSPNET